jgi:Na+-driven multidrug efflux pump
MWAFYFPFMRALQGAGDVRVPMWLALANTFGIAIPLAYALARFTDLGPTSIWIAQLASAVFVTLATGARLASGRWTRRAAPPPQGAPVAEGATR